jgi:hypothetical protein
MWNLSAEGKELKSKSVLGVNRVITDQA